MIKYLVSLSATNKIRCIIISCNEEWDDEQGGYVIERYSFQYKGKRTQQPSIIVSHGKAKRTTKEQLALEFNSLLKKQLDKGYKEINKDPDSMFEVELQEIVGDVKTDANDFAKHMLAKQADKVADSTINKLPYWYASKKLDGVRCGIYWDGESVQTASRGGGNYNCSMMPIITHQKLIDFFTRHPDWTLDGEIYKHGKSLMWISGEARRCETAYGSDELEFWIYDVMIPGLPFEKRLEILNTIKEELGLSYDPFKEWNEGDLRIQMLPQEQVTGLDNINKLHDQYVSEGFEGAVIRDPSKEYGFGKRDNRMLKIKKFSDLEATIKGIQEGLREEDMCFIMELDGKEFAAKPMGSRELKQYYRTHIDDIIGKQGTVKYFYLSEDGIPQLPVFKCVREE